ncbi:hypothetical protein DASB73_038200 [Starmerella bacillaris]|uniref:Uncharacterized protein n=1 Tax=Starmerella bacillaris TaxID=1247836 RepID=A0AAV5RP13_STABA|nr:hypothetical protein DASB73_038200 [Starmerella bacillaris]
MVLGKEEIQGDALLNAQNNDDDVKNDILEAVENTSESISISNCDPYDSIFMNLELLTKTSALNMIKEIMTGSIAKDLQKYNKAIQYCLCYTYTEPSFIVDNYYDKRSRSTASVYYETNVNLLKAFLDSTPKLLDFISSDINGVGIGDRFLEIIISLNEVAERIENREALRSPVSVLRSKRGLFPCSDLLSGRLELKIMTTEDGFSDVKQVDHLSETLFEPSNDFLSLAEVIKIDSVLDRVLSKTPTFTSIDESTAFMSALFKIYSSVNKDKKSEIRNFIEKSNYFTQTIIVKKDILEPNVFVNDLLYLHRNSGSVLGTEVLVFKCASEILDTLLHLVYSRQNSISQESRRNAAIIVASHYAHTRDGKVSCLKAITPMSLNLIFELLKDLPTDFSPVLDSELGDFEVVQQSTYDLALKAIKNIANGSSVHGLHKKIIRQRLDAALNGIPITPEMQIVLDDFKK